MSGSSSPKLQEPLTPETPSQPIGQTQFDTVDSGIVDGSLTDQQDYSKSPISPSPQPPPLIDNDDDLWKFEESDDESDSPPPPIPFTPPPSKTPTMEEPVIVSMFDPLNNGDSNIDNGTLTLLDVPISPTSNDDTQKSNDMILPPFPGSDMPKWYQKRVQSEPGPDLSNIQFELMTEEQDHIPASILPDTPQLSSLATTITDGSMTETESNIGFNDELDYMKEEDITPSTSKRNSWNTSSSFAYENDSPTGSLRSKSNRGDSDVEENMWSENTSSIVPARSPQPPSTISSDGTQSESSNAGTPNQSVSKRGGRRLDSRILALASQFEANSSAPTNSTQRSDSSNSSPEVSSRPKLQPIRRPTAMEVLATPSPSLLSKKVNVDDEEDIDMRKLRRSIVRGARAAVGLKSANDTVLNEPKLKRSVSLSPGESEQNRKNENSPQAKPRLERPHSLVLQKDDEASL